MTGLSTTGTIAALTLRRLVRGRVLWVSLVIATVPVVFTILLRRHGRSEYALTNDAHAFVQLVLSILPALFVASSIGEEIEDRTTTYLWSRPVPRWAVLAGKLLALVPIICALALGSWVASMFIGVQVAPSVASCLGFLLGTVALCIVAGTIGTLVPKYGMALAIVYMLFFDLPLGAMPASIRGLSISHHVRTIADLLRNRDDSPTSAAIGICAIALVWALVGLWRIRRLEA
jgi:ABC-type transport system involved in multi-copper enzyme maturation permease subunit